MSILSMASAIALLYYGRIFLITLIIAVIIAFILEPFVDLLMRIRLPRSVASFFVCSLALLVLYLAGLGFYFQSEQLISELPKYSQRVNELVDNVALKIEGLEKAVYELVVPQRLRNQEAPTRPPAPQERPPNRGRKAASSPPPPLEPAAIPEVRIRQERPALIGYLYERLSDVYVALLMASFVPFLVYFMLSWRDHIYRSFMRLFESEERMIADRTWDGIASMVRGFVVGNFVLAIVLASVSSLTFWLLKLPYPFLVGPLSGFLSVVPYIGVPLAIIPPFLAAITTANTVGAYVLIGTTVAVFHLIAMNLLYPKVVGARVHLNPLVVTLALMFWTVLWGEIGLILAIPITAGIKAVCDNVSGLQPYGKLLGD